MEEADLLKERLQAITDKRRIQEDIAKKRRQIEEEKLKLQYIKKKALRDQWLMDGLSQQSEEEQEAKRLQARDEQQQTDQLQSNILSIEKEVEALETQELSISANEEVILKRLKEVERTAEDIIKRATSVDREADGKELNKGCSTTEDHNSFSITMETAEQSELLMDCEVEVAVADSPVQGEDFNADDEQVCLENDTSVSPGNIPCTLLTDPPAGATEIDKPDSSASTDCTEIPFQDQKEVLIIEPGHEELNRNESVTSSVSDTLSSADSVYENEAHSKKQEVQQPPEQGPGQAPEPELLDPETDPEPEQYTGPEQEPEQYPEPKDDLDLVQYSGPEQDTDTELYPGPEQDTEIDFYPGPEQDTELDLYPGPEQDTEIDFYPGPEQDTELDLYPGSEQDAELDLYPEPEQQDELELYPEPEQQDELELYHEQEPKVDDNDFIPGNYDYTNLARDTEEDPEGSEILFEPAITQESALEQRIREEVMSNVSNESCHDLDPEEMDECLRVEIAAASSDSETDEKWRTIFSSSINKEDDDSYLDSLQLSAQELFVQKVEVTDYEEQEHNFEGVCFEVPQVEEVLEQPEDIMYFPSPSQEVKYNPLGNQSLAKISEDESENGRDANHNQTTYQEQNNAESNKKLPKDFCVIQETKSENVSTEHVDFQLARKQWREMEEQMKNKVILPTTKPSFHGSHSFMYTPVRNIERTHKKAHELENLNLVGDYSHTQFSPCSEDSGLDDSSYRSAYEDPETPVEREIRLSMEREENFRRERGFSRMGKSTDCAPSRSMPRSISTPLTPSFIITSSPTKEPLKHDVTANNVIILDPSKDFASGPRHGKDNGAGRPGEWCSEDSSSNVIILETSNLIIRSASEFSLNKACEQPQEKMFLNNPFFKLRSRSTISLVDEEIKLVKQREEEMKKERATLYGKDRLSNHMDTLTFDNSVDVPVKCKSSPSSPMKTAYRMDRSVLSCDHRSDNLGEEVEVEEVVEEVL
ncbi:FK506-binding protein 5 isoform X2 [Betta splendens]|uniref:FK506-binding protein 5 isoform X2 n=1 Tax=Betta splendens TaxID=158456 RepID=A0A6P7M6P4_BETSP|nr:FK506-binding protein 5 isoform X2 [Betta splendens]